MIDAPAHGFISSTENIASSTITFSCDKSYMLQGDEYIECRPNGFWNGKKSILLESWIILAYNHVIDERAIERAIE